MSQNRSPQRVLLVDQEQDWLAFGRTALAEAGYRVETAESAAKALARIQTQEFDLILLDMKEAERDNTTIGKIVASQVEKRYHVVIVSPTDLTPVKMRTAFKLGAYDCVDKQYDQAGLCQLVREQFAEIDRPAPCVPGGIES